MAKVFTTVPGAAIRIGAYGMATNDTPAVVPEEVADELQAEMKGESAAPADPEKGIPARHGRSPHNRYRIERDVPPKTSARASTPSAGASAMSATVIKDVQKGKED